MSIAVDKCDPGVVEDVARIAAIELHATRVASDDGAPDVTRIEIACESDEVALRVKDPLTSKEVSRKVSVAGIDQRARARTIALAVAELVSASWVELETTPEPKVQPIPKRVVSFKPKTTHAKPALAPQLAPQLAPRPEAPSLPLVLEALVSGRVFFESRELLLGGGVRVEPWVARNVLLRFDAFVEHASATRVPGDVNVDAASGAAAAGLAASFAAVRLTTTLGLRAGYARLVGFAHSENLRGQVLEGAWVGPEIALGLELFPRAHVHAVITYTLGWALAGVTGPVPGDRDVLAQGPYGALAIGFAAN